MTERWCTRCERHIIVGKQELCPVCEDDDTRKDIAEKTAMIMRLTRSGHR